MTETLLFLLGASPEAPLRWGRFEGPRLLEGGWLENAADISGFASPGRPASRVVALLPGEQIAARRTAPLSRNPAKAGAAAAYVMEDELGEAADGLHIVVAAAGETALAIAVKRSILEGWFTAFSVAGMEPDILSADYLALAPQADSAAVIFEGQRVIAGFEGAGLAVEIDLFRTVAQNLFKAPPTRIEAIGDATLRRLLPLESEIDWLGSADDARILAFYGHALGALPNLLQGSFAKKRALMPLLAPWRRAATIAAAVVGVFAVGVVAQSLRAEYVAKEWTKAARTIHAARFPDETSTDPVAHAREVLARGGAGSSFVALAARFSEAVARHEAVSLERIRFNAETGEFAVSIRSKTDTGIDEMKATLASLGVVTEDNGGYRRSGDFWNGELSARLQ